MTSVVEPLTEVRPPVLSADGVGKTYGNQTVALSDVTFSLRDGEFVSLVGPSGCGKSTLLKACTGLLRPTSGVIAYRGSGAGIEPGRYGIVFQTAALLPWRTVLANVMLPTTILPRRSKKADRTRALELLELVQLEGQDEKYPSELSGGMQQRVAIARALLHDPDVLFMDEPFGALDAMTREELNMQLQRIHLDQGKSVLFVTHSIQEAVLLSDRILVMGRDPGRIIADVEVPLARPRTPRSMVSADFRQIEGQVRAALDSAQPDVKRSAWEVHHDDDA